MKRSTARLLAQFCWIKETGEFIRGAIEGGGQVLVHCFAGVSRSASVVIAYLMRYHNMTYSQACAHVRDRRPWINPNPGFVNQLKRYETWLADHVDFYFATNWPFGECVKVLLD